MEHNEQPSTFFGLRASAVLEMLIFFVTALLLDALLLDGARYANLSPHPFWIVVVLMSVQYGTVEGIAAAVLSTALLLIGNMPEETIGQDMYGYLFTVVSTPLQWLVASVVLGELRMKHLRERAQLREALDQSGQREEKITQQYGATRELKDRLEMRIAGQLRSSVATYQAAKAMEALSPNEVLSGLQDLLMSALNPDQFSVYTLDDDGLTATLTHGWKQGEYAESFGSGSELFRSVIGRRQVLVIANSDHERALTGHGVLAGPLVDRDTGEVVGMLKIESLGFTELNLSSVESFAAICEWAGMALANARKYQTARAGSMVNPDHNLYTQNYFQKHADYIGALGKRVGFDVNMVLVKLANADELATDARNAVARALSQAVDRVLRTVDLAFDYQGSGEEYSIVLPATDKRGAEIVMEKIRGQLNTLLSGPAARANFAFSIQSIQGK